MYTMSLIITRVTLLMVLIMLLSKQCGVKASESENGSSFKLINQVKQILLNFVKPNEPNKLKETASKNYGDNINPYRPQRETDETSVITTSTDQNIRIPQVSSDISQFMDVPSTTATLPVAQGPTTASPLYSHNLMSYPFFGLRKRLPPLTEGFSSTDEDWKPITYSMAAIATATPTTRKTVFTNPATTTTIKSVFKLNPSVKPSINSDLPMNKGLLMKESIIYGAPEVTDGSVEEQDALSHDINYYQAMNQGNNAVQGDFLDSNKFQAMAQNYSLNERDTPHIAAPTSQNDTATLQQPHTEAKIESAAIKYNATGIENNNSTVVPEKNAIETSEMTDIQTKASNIAEAGYADNTWLEISNSYSTEAASKQFNQNTYPLNTNETTWPSRSSASSSSLSEEDEETIALDTVSLSDDTLVTIHTSAATGINDPITSLGEPTKSSATRVPSSKTTICVPMLVSEKSATDPDIFMEVERVVCFPLRPEMNVNFNKGDDDDEQQQRQVNHRVNEMSPAMSEGNEPRNNVNNVLAEKVHIFESDFDEQEFYSKGCTIKQNIALFVATLLAVIILY